MKKGLSFTIVMLCFSAMINAQPRADGCNTNTPGWGNSLGRVSFVSDRTWTVGNQIWSDAVTAAACQKTTFDGGTVTTYPLINLIADCRSNTAVYAGDLFSWCAVVRFADTLCPHPWRVPTVRDFVLLDRAFGGTGYNRSVTIQFITNNYILRWGGEFGGFCFGDGTLSTQGSRGNYWSLSEFYRNPQHGYLLHFSREGWVDPQSVNRRSSGFKLRCVKNN